MTSLQSILTIAEAQRARAVTEKKMGMRRTAKTEQAQFTTHGKWGKRRERGQRTMTQRFEGRGEGSRDDFHRNKAQKRKQTLKRDMMTL